MKVRFQADADFNQNIVRAVRRRDPAIDFQTAHEARLHGVDDAMVLARAAEEGRLVVSHDYRTMPRHFATFVITRTSAGVIMVSQAIPLSGRIYEFGDRASSNKASKRPLTQAGLRCTR
jgi:hypothetical protein